MRFYTELLIVERFAVPVPMLWFDFIIPPLIVLIILLVSVSVVTLRVRPGATVPPEKLWWDALTTDFWITGPWEVFRTCRPSLPIT